MLPNTSFVWRRGREGEATFTLEHRGPFVYITPVDSHSRTVEMLVEIAAEQGRVPAYRFADGTPAVYMAESDGLQGTQSMAVMPTKEEDDG